MIPELEGTVAHATCVAQIPTKRAVVFTIWLLTSRKSAGNLLSLQRDTTLTFAAVNAIWTRFLGRVAISHTYFGLFEVKMAKSPLGRVAIHSKMDHFLCCHPKEYTGITIVYVDEEDQIWIREVPNMVL
jgi:hypothetical protein